MNAYDMANEIQDSYCEGKKLTEIANMLRQQADRIAELEKDSAWWKSQYEQMCRDFQYYKGKHDQEIKRQEDWEKATRERGKYGIY